MRQVVAVAALAAAFAAPARAHEGDPQPFGEPADPRQAARTIRIEMSDAMRFSPARITVQQGQAVRFVAMNGGRLEHEMVLGTLEDLNKHAELMRKYPHMEHDEPHMAHVAPGASGEIAWRFTRAGEFYFGCLVPGHFEAGMIGRIVVAPQGAR